MEAKLLSIYSCHLRPFNGAKIMQFTENTKLNEKRNLNLFCFLCFLYYLCIHKDQLSTGKEWFSRNHKV